MLETGCSALSSSPGSRAARSCLSPLLRSPQTAILAASAFYLVGGTVGLVMQLQSAATGATATQDDYGLGIVRLIPDPAPRGPGRDRGVALVQLAAVQNGTDGTNFSLPTTFNSTTTHTGSWLPHSSG